MGQDNGGFKKDKWMNNSGYGDANFEIGSHMFLKIADVFLADAHIAICVQSNTSATTRPPLFHIAKSVFGNGMGRGSHTSLSELYVMLDDMAMGAGRLATQAEILGIRNGLIRNIQNVRFSMIVRTDAGYEYSHVNDKQEYDLYFDKLKDVLNVRSQV